MKLELRSPYLSIEQLNEFELPDFAVLIGLNGVGKTQLLDAIKNNQISVSDSVHSDIEKYDFNSFQPKSSKAAKWETIQYFDLEVQKFFSPNDGSTALVEVARKIYEDKSSQYANDDSKLNKFDQITHEYFDKGIQGKIFGSTRGINCGDYINEIKEKVIGPAATLVLTRGNQKKSVASSLLPLAMKISGKLPHLLNEEDFLNATNYEGETIANRLSEVFTTYKLEQFVWAHRESETCKRSVKNLLQKYTERTPAPWVKLRNHLESLRAIFDNEELFNFEFTDPENDGINFSSYQDYQFHAQFRNLHTGKIYPLENLSSGEKILMSLCLATFNRKMGRHQPSLILLDELDAVLHPSMIKAYIYCLKEFMVENGTRVIIATHSATTVSMLEDGEIFRIERVGRNINVVPVSKSNAVSELSEGLATIDNGLRIAASSNAAPITILTEGNNTLHLKRWAQLFFPDEVSVFDELPSHRSNSQLVFYGRLLSKMNINSHILIVWDWDAKSYAKQLTEELTNTQNVTAFCFEQRSGTKESKGIENKYDYTYLSDFLTASYDTRTNTLVSRNMSSKNKKEFAEHVNKSGTKDYFEHYDDLKMAVEKILEKA